MESKNGDDIQEEIQSFRENEEVESKTTNGRNGISVSGLGFEGNNDQFQLEADSEQEQDEDENQERERINVDQDNGYNAQEMLTETAEDQLTSEQNDYVYGEEDYTVDDFDEISQSQANKMMKLANTEGSFIESYLTKQSKGGANDENQDTVEDLASNDALAKLKARIHKQTEQRTRVDPEEVLDNFRNLIVEKKPLDNERIDKFFQNNKFLTDFREQTDQMAVHECYKAMVLKPYEIGRSVSRYGSTGDECHFIIKGKIEMYMPECEKVLVNTEQDLIKFYAEHYDQVIWEKVEDAQEIKEMARMYQLDPENLDFTERVKTIQRIERISDTIADMPFERQVSELQEELKRPQSGFSSSSRQGKRVASAKKRQASQQKRIETAKSQFSAHSRYDKNSQPQSKPQTSKQTNLQFGRGAGKSSLDSKGARANFIENGSQDNDSDKTFTEEVWLLKKIETLTSGDCFGQTDLVESKMHHVTYICTEACEIASFNRESYVRIVEKAVKRDFQGRIQFLKSFKVLSTMSQNQLESLLYHVKLINFERGRTVFKAGEKPDGVYLIQEGAFELTKPGQMHQKAEKIVEKMNVDPMAKFQLRKQAKVIKDGSRMTVKLAILGSGEMFGLEECSVKPTSFKISDRQYSVTCQENGSKVVFISHAAFAEKVLYDPNVEKAIKFNCALKEFFHNSRELQYQQTVWNGALTSVKQIENAAEKADADFEEKIKKDLLGTISRELKGLPRLRTVDQYFKDKFEAEVLNKIMGQIHQRTAESIDPDDEGMKRMIAKKMRDIENHFDATVNVINAERKEQKKAKDRLQEYSETQKQNEIRFNESIAASKVQISQGSVSDIKSQAQQNQDILRDQSYFQDSLISTQHPNNMSLRQPSFEMSISNQGRAGQGHFASVDNNHMKIIHSVVKEKRPLQFSSITGQQNFGFVSMDKDISLVGRRRNELPPVDSEPSESKIISQFGLNSEAQTVNQQPTTFQIHKNKTMAMDQPKSTIGEIIPQTQGGRSDGIEFKGRQDTHVSNKPDTSIEQREKGNIEQKSPMNRTQDAFNHNENKLLDMFDENNQKLLDQNQIMQTGIASEIDQINEKKANDGGIIVSQVKQDHQRKLNVINIDKKFQNISEQQNAQQNAMKIHERKESGFKAQDGKNEISDTVSGPPSNLGNVSSNIRDPRYSQEKIQQQKKSALRGPMKKKLGLASNISVPGQKPFGQINIDVPVKIPKVSDDKDQSPVYQEGDEINEEVLEVSSPVVNITTRLTSKRSSAQGTRDENKSKPVNFTEQVVQKETVQQNSQENLESKPNANQLQGALGNELPYNEFNKNQGFKGNKRNQIQVSKTLNDKAARSKLRMINKDSANLLPSDHVEAYESNLPNSFTVDMPEVYSQNYQQTPAARHGMPSIMFPNIVTHIGGKDGNYLRNADISMIDTAQFSQDPAGMQSMNAGGGFGQNNNMMRVMETHHSNQSKREVFVPSQMNPRMRRNNGKTLAEKRLAQQMLQKRGVSAKSFDTKSTNNKSRNAAVAGFMSHQNMMPGQAIQHPQHQRANSLRKPHQHQGGFVDDYTPAPIPIDLNASSRQASMNQTGNSYAKQMQNLDDTQYRAAMMREAHNQQMMIEAARSALNSQQLNQQQDAGVDPLQQMMDTDSLNLGGQSSTTPFNLSPAAAAAASELIQRFITNPGEPISTEHFLHVQRKYELPPFEAYQLLLQQIQFQKALLTPPTAATVIKVGHFNYTQSIRDKREEVINFRQDLFKRYTYRKRSEQNSASKGKGAKPNKTSTSIQTGPGPVVGPSSSSAEFAAAFKSKSNGGVASGSIK